MESDDDGSDSVNAAKKYRRSIRRLKTKNLEMRRSLRDKDREIDALKLRCRETELPNAHPPEKNAAVLRMFRPGNPGREGG